MTDKELHLIRRILGSLNDGYTPDTFRWEMPWSPVMEKLLIQIAKEEDAKVALGGTSMPEWIVFTPFGLLINWAIRRLKEMELDEINKKDGTGIVRPMRLNMDIGDPNRISTERL